MLPFRPPIPSDSSTHHAAMDHTMARSSGAPLLELLPELLNAVCSMLSQHNLSVLMQTCKALKSAVAPILYNHVVLRVPVSWERLASIESLAGCSEENLLSIRHITIATRHNPSKEHQKSLYRALTLHEVLGSRYEDSPASRELNLMVRMLIIRMPRNQLQSIK